MNIYLTGYHCLVFFEGVKLRNWKNILKNMNYVHVGIAIVLAILFVWTVLIMIRKKKSNLITNGYIAGVLGQYSGQTIPIAHDEIIVLGRDPAFSHIVFEDNYHKISRRHCSIQYNAHQRTYTLIDMSSNGVYSKKGKRYPQNQEVILPSGTTICLGNMENTIKLE